MWEKVYNFSLEKIEVPNNQVAKYLQKERCYSQDMVKEMGIGYIPAKKQLAEHLKSTGVPEAAVLEIIKSLGYIGGNHKMVIPYYDKDGSIIGLAARNVKHDPNDCTSKYMYTKGLVRNNTLLNIHNVDRNKELLIVEGVLDCLHAKAQGITNVVTLGGTGFSPKQAELLKEVGISKITLCLDNDKAGQDATYRIAGLIFDKQPDAQVRIAKLPDGIKDFDELLKVKGIVKTLETVTAAKIQDRNELEAIRSNTISQEPAHSLKQTM